MSGVDFTRWNRAGLRRLFYVDGNAVLFLELLRAQLKQRFGERWASLPSGVELLDDEDAADPELRQQQRNERLIQLYHGKLGDDRDLAWGLTRAVSRSSHVLAAHVEAHANEAFLRTATQWESIRRIVELIDYHPAIATSAVTDIVVEVKQGKSGVLPRGFQIKHTPVDGSSQVIFETLEDTEVHCELNELRPKGWDASQDPSASPGAGPAGPSFSALAQSPVIALEGVGTARAAALDTLLPSHAFRIKDFLDLDPAHTGLSPVTASETWLRELKAKAVTVCSFQLEAGWDKILDWPLPAVAAASAQSVAELTGKPLADVSALQQSVELLGACLDHGVYRNVRLRDCPTPPAQPGTLDTFWRAPSKPQVAVGQVAMVFHGAERRGEAVTIASIDETTRRIRVKPSPLQFSWWRWPKREARLRVVSRWKRKAWLNGSNVVRTRAPHGWTKGAFVAWRAAGGALLFAEVLEADERNLRLKTGSPLPGNGTELLEARQLTGTQVASNMEFGLVGAVLPPKPFKDEEPPEPPTPTASDVLKSPAELEDIELPELMPPGGLDFGSFLFPSPFLPMDLVKAAVELMLSLGVMVIPSTGKPVFKFLNTDAITALAARIAPLIPSELWKPGVPADKVAAIKDVLTAAAQKAVASAEPPVFKNFEEALIEAVEAHGPLLGVRTDATVKAVVERSVPQYVCDGAPDKIEAGDWIVAEYSLGLAALRVSEIILLGGGDAPEFFGIAFEGSTSARGELRAVYADFRGDLEQTGSAVNESAVDPAKVELSPVPASLKRGRRVLLTAPGKPPLPSRVADVDALGVRLEPPPVGYTKHELVIRGNVVVASHGAAKPPKKLSSGAAANQRTLVLGVVDVATVADPTFPSGVRADLEVNIGGMTWRQVPRLDDSGPTDPHYAVRAMEEGFLALVFGDGEHGRRLPSGTNNVSVGFRVGAGRAGNLPAGSLTKAVHPHWLVRSLEQPKASVGGEAMESVDDIRERAPGTLLALERSVSIADFENLAASRSDVWQAKAFFHPGGRGKLDLVRVVVVPSGGGEASGSFAVELEDFLTQNAVPTVAIRVDGFVENRVALDVTLRVDEARFDPTEVLERVRTTLVTRLGLERRVIAQPMYLSEVYRLVEGTFGVQDSHCAFRGTTRLSQRPEGEDAVVFLAPDVEDLRLDVERYVP